MCKKVKCFAHGNKYGMAASLLNWLKMSTVKGRQNYMAAIEDIKARRKVQNNNLVIAA